MSEALNNELGSLASYQAVNTTRLKPVGPNLTYYPNGLAVDSNIELVGAPQGQQRMQIRMADPVSGNVGRFGWAADTTTVGEDVVPYMQFYNNAANGLTDFYSNNGWMRFTGWSGTKTTFAIQFKGGSTPRTIVSAANTAPANTSDYVTSDESGKQYGAFEFYLDESNNKLMIKVLYSDGTTAKSGEVALT